MSDNFFYSFQEDTNLRKFEDEEIFCVYKFG